MVGHGGYRRVPVFLVRRVPVFFSSIFKNPWQNTLLNPCVCTQLIVSARCQPEPTILCAGQTAHSRKCSCAFSANKTVHALRRYRLGWWCDQCLVRSGAVRCALGNLRGPEAADGIRCCPEESGGGRGRPGEACGDRQRPVKCGEGQGTREEPRGRTVMCGEGPGEEAP